MCELYINKNSLFEYWQYTEDYTSNDLPKWLVNDEDIKIIRIDDNLILLDKIDREYAEISYGDYILKRITDEYIPYITDKDVILRFNDISNRFIKYKDYFIRKSDIIEAYKYDGIYNPDSMPSWVIMDTFEARSSGCLGIMDTLHHRYMLVEPNEYICRYLNDDNQTLFKESYFKSHDYMKLNRTILGYKEDSKKEYIEENLKKVKNIDLQRFITIIQTTDPAFSIKRISDISGAKLSTINRWKLYGVNTTPNVMRKDDTIIHGLEKVIHSLLISDNGEVKTKYLKTFMDELRKSVDLEVYNKEFKPFKNSKSKSRIYDLVHNVVFNMKGSFKA